MIREVLIGTASLAIALCGLQAATTEAQKPAPGLPGVTAKDPFPEGCVSCHVKLPDGRDMRLNAALKAVEGHPSVTAMVKSAPADCKKCHTKASGMGLELVLHKAHYGKGEKSHFVQEFGGSCLACHALDVKTGKMTVKSGPKNW